MDELTNRQRKALETKNNLLSTALELFQKKGFDNVTVDEITDACNVSKGAFYNHFSSKHDVLIYRFKDIDAFYSTFSSEIESLNSATEKIIMFYTKQMQYLCEILGKELLRTVYASALSSAIKADHFLISPHRNINKILLGYIQEGLRNGEFQSHYTADELLMIITRCMRGTVYDWIIFKDKLDPVKEILKITMPVLKGIQTNLDE